MAQVLPKHRAREYETIFILHPETTTDSIEQVAGKLTDVVNRLEGKLIRAENWGRRRLAYHIRKQQKGIYVYLRYLGYSDMVGELERVMRMQEPIIKYLTVKLEEDVNPDARPVKEDEISFLPHIDETSETAKSKPVTESSEKTSEEAETKSSEEAKSTAAAQESASDKKEPVVAEDSEVKSEQAPAPAADNSNTAEPGTDEKTPAKSTKKSEE